MAKIIDLDDISYVVDTSAGGEDEMEIQTGAKTIQLLAQGVLSDDSPGATSGITGKCFYSKLKKIWQDDNALNKHLFPIQMIYEASFIWINGWSPLDQQTRDLVRDAGFKEGDLRENACIISLGAMDDSANDQAYYTNITGFDQTKTDLDKTGELNENIQIKGTGGTPDTSNYFKAFLREEQKSFASYNLLTEQGLAALKFEAYRLPLANGTDIKAIDNDNTISVTDAGSLSGVKYSELTIDYFVGNLFETALVQSYVADDVIQDTAGRWARCTTGGTMDAAGVADYTNNGGTALWEAYPGERLIGTEYFAFNRVLDVKDTTNGYSARLPEIHSWAQYKLRQASDINDDVNGDAYGTINGNIAVPFTGFVGDTLHTKPGVFIDDYHSDDKNSIIFWDVTVDEGGVDTEGVPIVSTDQKFPFTASGSLLFSQNFVDEPDGETRYTMYFQYITSTAVTGVKITGSSGASATIDYTGDAGKLNHLLTNDYIKISGFTTETGNNGLWKCTGDPTTNTIAADKVDGVNPTDESVGDNCTVLENPFESPGAIIVDNDSNADIDGEITSGTIGWDFKYTTNNQGGRTPNSPAPIYVVALAYDGAQYTLVSSTITENTGINIAVNAVDELNYEDVP